MGRAPKTSTTLLKQIAGAAEHPRWGEFVAKYRPMMDAYAQSRFPGLEADDLVQETLLAVMHALPGYVETGGEKGAFHNFLTGVLRHKALDALRQAGRREELTRVLASDSRGRTTGMPREREEEAWRETVFAAALEQVLADPRTGDRTKRMFVRTAVNGESAAAVAASLQTTCGAVEEAKRRMMAKLRDIVERLERADRRI